MAWQVEYTDEFGKWWDELEQPERAAIEALVQLLKVVVRRWDFRTAVALTAPSMVTCVSFERNAVANRCELCMPLTRAGWQSC